MKVLIVGSEGSMGKRYQAILRYLGYEVMCADKQHSLFEINILAKSADRIIVATPTETHVPILKSLIPLRKPILCEKPVCKDLEALKRVIDFAEMYQTKLAMVMQYKYLVKDTEGDSYYNYFRHGNDGLTWDCFQIIALAKGEVELREASPIWTCEINGTVLNLSDMDVAYIKMVKFWVTEPYSDLDTLYSLHKKVSDYADKASSHSYSS